MTFAEFEAIVKRQPDGVVLLEGRRAITPPQARLAKELAAKLARHFPRLRFRSGNATGSDESFAEGITRVDASRLQVVAPYSSHRMSARYPDALYDSPESLSPVQEEAVAYKTASASPKHRRLVEMRHGEGALPAKAAYLIRDTMKVTGRSEQFPKPICGLFVVDLEDPTAGGTGHTIRVCEQEGIPVAFQDSWQQWRIEKAE